MLLETYHDEAPQDFQHASIESPHPNLFTLWGWDGFGNTLLAEATAIRDLEAFAKALGVKEINLKATLEA